MSRAECITVLCLGCALVLSIYLGARAAVTPEPVSGPRPRALDPHGLAGSPGVAMREGVDPLNPPGMPAGARIDPETGLLSGVHLETENGEYGLRWPTLAAADDAQDARALPESIRALDGAPVLVAGFLMPLYAMRDIREFALVGSHYTCCFGTPPGLGGQILVTLARGQHGLEPTVRPMWVRGTFRIRELRLHEGRQAPLVSLFEIVDARAGLLEYK